MPYATREKSLKWKKDNDKGRLEYQRRWCKENLGIINNLKDKPCMDCGNKFPPICMDFDHVRGKKVANISKLARAGKIDEALKEIEKCDLVCANCHRLRTDIRRQQAKVAYG